MHGFWGSTSAGTTFEPVGPRTASVGQKSHQKTVKMSPDYASQFQFCFASTFWKQNSSFPILKVFDKKKLLCKLLMFYLKSRSIKIRS